MRTEFEYIQIPIAAILRSVCVCKGGGGGVYHILPVLKIKALILH